MKTRIDADKQLLIDKNKARKEPHIAYGAVHYCPISKTFHFTVILDEVDRCPTENCNAEVKEPKQ